MITEDYVSFEVAKLLEEKGFDKYPIFPCYADDGSKLFIDIPTTLDTINYHFIPAPTLQMAMKWLREVYDLHIIAYPWRANKEERATHWCSQVYKSFNLSGYEKYTNETPKSYEEACECAIRYCLENLI